MMERAIVTITACAGKRYGENNVRNTINCKFIMQLSQVLGGNEQESPYFWIEFHGDEFNCERYYCFASTGQAHEAREDILQGMIAGVTQWKN